MTDILALIAAIFLLLQLNMLRAALSFAFVPRSARALDNVRIPEAMADLHAEAARELGALGYSGPDWFQDEVPASSIVPAQLYAVWRNVSTGDTVWLAPPVSAAQPNRLLSWFVRRLEDGRHCISQPFDAIAEISADERFLGQTIGGDDFAAQHRLHAQWCDTQGRADLAGTDAAALHWQATRMPHDRIESLSRRGTLYRDRSGLLRPTLGFALRMLGAMRRTPKYVSRGTVPPARLAWLARVQHSLTLRPVPRRVQAGLFAFSVVLFLAAGAWFWNVQVALILFVVIVIHELGHYLAMLAFGYRNVQMLALPLVGGVTIGHEARPDAARRAWMSLMGPLPGIVIGWVLLWLMLAGQGNAGLVALITGQDTLLYQAALLFLIVNYINVIPVPPLDGAHVVQELLPTGAPRLSAAFIVVACLIGGAAAIWAGFYLLAVLAALQLPLARSRWKLGAVLRQLRNDPQLQKTKIPALRRQRLFEVFDALQGQTAQAAPRLALAAEVERSLDVRPMRPLQRLSVGLVYGLLLAGPLALLVISFGLSPMWPVVSSAATDRHAEQAREWQRRAGEQELATLAAQVLAYRREMLAQPEFGATPPATATALAAASTRLGKPLPAEVTQIYGLPEAPGALVLLPPEHLQRASEADGLNFNHAEYEGDIAFFAPGLAERHVKLTPAQLSAMLLLGRNEDQGELLFYDDATPPLHAGLRVYVLSENDGSIAAADLRGRLEQLWAGFSQNRHIQQEYNDSLLRERAAVADASLEQLLAQLEPPEWWQRQLYPDLAWPGPADAAHIAATAQRLGHEIPPDLQAIYTRHDGFPPLQLLPLDLWQPVTQLDVAVRERWQAQYMQPRDFPDTQHCIVIGGYATKNVLYHPSVFWCPGNAPESRLLNAGQPQRAARVEALLREIVAQQRLMNTSM